MADTATQTIELQAKLTLSRGTTQTTRTLTVQNPDYEGTDFRANMATLRDELTNGSLSAVVQPASWRDDDPLSPPYTTDNVEFRLVYDLDSTPTAPNFTLTPGGYSSVTDLARFFNNGQTIHVDSDSGYTNYEFTELYTPNSKYSVGMTAASGGGMDITVQIPSSGIEVINPVEGGETATVFTLQLTGAEGLTTTKTFTAPNWTPRVQND